MTPRTWFTLAAVAVVMLAGSLPAQAQDRYDFKVPFAFVANGKAFPAGSYSVKSSESDAVLSLEAADPKNGMALLPVETRISEQPNLADPEIVFDKLDGKLYVSELLAPGNDGYMVLVTKAKHTHEVLKGTHTKK